MKLSISPAVGMARAQPRREGHQRGPHAFALLRKRVDRVEPRVEGPRLRLGEQPREAVADLRQNPAMPADLVAGHAADAAALTDATASLNIDDTDADDA